MKKVKVYASWEDLEPREYEYLGSKDGMWADLKGTEPRMLGFCIPLEFVPEMDKLVRERIALKKAVDEHSAEFYKLNNRIVLAGR